MSVQNGESQEHQRISIMLDEVDQYSVDTEGFPRTVTAQANYLSQTMRFDLVEILCSVDEPSLLERFDELRAENPAIKGVQSKLFLSPVKRVHYIACYLSEDDGDVLKQDYSPVELGFLKLVSLSPCNFRHNEESPTVIGIVYLQPKRPNLLPRPALKVIYLSDSFIDYVALEELGSSYQIAENVYSVDPSLV